MPLRRRAKKENRNVGSNAERSAVEKQRGPTALRCLQNTTTITKHKCFRVVSRGGGVRHLRRRRQKSRYAHIASPKLNFFDARYQRLPANAHSRRLTWMPAPLARPDEPGKRAARRRSRSAFSSFDWTRNIVAAEDRPLRRQACGDDSDNGSNGDESAATDYGSENGSDGSNTTTVSTAPS